MSHILKDKEMKKIKLFIIVTSILISSCSSPLDRKFNDETAKEDIVELKEELDSTELGLLVMSMMRLKFQNKELEEMTYSEIIEDGKEWKRKQDKLEAEQKELALKAKLEEENRIELLNQSVTVSCYSKGYDEYDYQKYITYKFVIKNKSEKEIRALKGQISFMNLFDEEIKTLNFVYDQPIESSMEVSYNATTEYNQFSDSDKALKNKDLKDLKVVWKPSKVIFSDGSTLE
jgi:hypothetical protein